MRWACGKVNVAATRVRVTARKAFVATRFSNALENWHLLDAPGSKKNMQELHERRRREQEKVRNHLLDNSSIISRKYIINICTITRRSSRKSYTRSTTTFFGRASCPKEWYKSFASGRKSRFFWDILGKYTKFDLHPPFPALEVRPPLLLPDQIWYGWSIRSRQSPSLHTPRKKTRYEPKRMRWRARLHCRNIARTNWNYCKVIQKTEIR